jgi:hypothetical protein
MDTSETRRNLYQHLEGKQLYMECKQRHSESTAKRQTEETTITELLHPTENSKNREDESENFR